MRAFVLAMTILSLAVPAAAETDIAATCYTKCEKSTDSNPTYKACLARAADAADAKLNDSYKALQAAIRDGAKAHGPKAGYLASRADHCPEGMDRLSRRQLHLRGRTRLRGHLDRRQLLGLPVRAQLPACRRL